VALLIAIPAGVYAAAYQNSWVDKLVRWFAAAGQSFPNFWVATMLILVFSVELHVVPSSGDSGWRSFVLPVATIVIFLVSGLARLTRSAMLEVLKTDYIKFARAKGASNMRVLWLHAFRNGSVTVLAFAALLLLSMLNLIIVVETVFAWPGVGQFIIEAVQSRDFPVIQFIVLLMATIYAVGNLFTDLAYAVVDPRIRYA
jgi:peptide/nickel transport system permease protein